MKIRTSFDRTVVVRDDVAIPLADGTVLRATIWLPDDATERPVPALLEYLPYRRSDWTAPRDAQRHPWYAGHGYASVRVDMRGSGDSDGVLLDEYHAQEQADGLEVIAWLAAQPWCTGKVGMFGISWGGFNSLQLAALNPPALAAIVTVCSTDDRYKDDVHYFGGALLGIDMSAWAGLMVAFQSRPPDPLHVGEAWREMWRERLEGLQPLAEIWMEHQERDDYWRHGSVNEDYSGIKAAVLAVGGWADPYRGGVLRLIENLDAPVRGIIGPWAHQYPDIDRTPGPTIGFLQETLRWWDRWLKGVDNDVLAEPALRVYHQESVRPATHYPRRAGQWLGLSSWPAAEVSRTTLPLGDALRSLAINEAGLALIDTPQHNGVDAARYFPFGNLSDLPPDQRAEDGRSVVFETAPLQDDLEILGFARLSARVSSTTERAHLIARLCDVAPDGSSTLITRGAINLTHRHGMDRIDAVPVDEFVDAEIEFVAISWQVPAGHRLRLSLSNTYWPWIWPHGRSGSLLLDATRSSLTIDTLDRSSPGVTHVEFDEPEQASPLDVATPDPGAARRQREVTYDPQTGTYTLVVDPHYGGNRVFPNGLCYSEDALETYTVSDNDPLTARAESQWHVKLQRDDWSATIDTTSTITGSETHFFVENTVRALDGDELFFERSYRKVIPRTSA